MIDADADKSAMDDYLAISWRHHAKRDMPISLIGKQVAGEDMGRLADDACQMVDVLLSKPSRVSSSEDTSTKALLIMLREHRRRGGLWADREDMISRIDAAMATLDTEEWYYFWGLHQILYLLPQTLEER